MPKERALITQSNRLIEARYTLTAAEQKLILALISKIHPEDDDLKPYEMPLDELAQLMGITLSNCRLEIAAITKRLIGRVLTLQSEPGHFVQIGWICRAAHKPGSVSVSFVPDLKPYLLRLKSEFTVCELGVVNQFSSKYTIRLYLLLKQYAAVGWREFELQELRHILGIEKNKYREYKRFNQRILAQAKKEMDAMDSGRPGSDLTFEVETIRGGRKIARLKFIIKNKTKAGKGGNGGKSVEQLTVSEIKPQPPAKRHTFPERWDEFLQYLELNDPGLLPIIASEGPECVIVKAPYLAWRNAFNGK